MLLAAQAYGAGVYFARDSRYSTSTTYSQPDGHGIQRMFMCRVAVGEYCLGKSGARVVSTAGPSGSLSCHRGVPELYCQLAISRGLQLTLRWFDCSPTHGLASRINFLTPRLIISATRLCILFITIHKHVSYPRRRLQA